jgi:hypothetical protein
MVIAASDRAIARSGLKPPKQPSSGRPVVLIAIGYLAALLIPLIGFIIGVVLWRRGGLATRHGRWITAIAVAVVLIGAASHLSGAGQHTGSDHSPAIQPLGIRLPPEQEAELREIERQQTR